MPADIAPPNSPNAPAPTLEPLLIPAAEAARLAGVSTSMFWKLKNSKRCPDPVRLGRKMLWRLEDIRQWVADGCPPASRWKAFQIRQERAKILDALPKPGAQ